MESSTIDVDQSASALQAERPSQAVVRAVADEAGVDQTDLPPLFHAIDPDALDALFRAGGRPATRRTTGAVRFSYHGYEVSVEADGSVSLESAGDH